MRKIIFVFLGVSFLLFDLKGQDSLKKVQLGLDFSIGNNAVGRRNILPSITVSKGKHLVFIGPAFIFGMNYNPYPPAYGVQAGYQFYPNGKDKRFNLFFEYDFNFVSANFKFQYSGATGTFGVEKRAISVSSFDNYLGFGFRFNIYKGLYLKTNVGLGMIVYNEKITDEYVNGDIIKVSNPQVYVGEFYPFGNFSPYYGNQYYYYGYKHFVGIVKIGIGCDLYSFKKKKSK